MASAEDVKPIPGTTPPAPRPRAEVPAPKPVAAKASSPTVPPPASNRVPSPAARGSASPGGSPSKSGTAKDARGLSAVDEANLERSIIRRGLATPQEIEACRALRSKHPDKGLLELCVGSNILTKSQAQRLMKEPGEGGSTLSIPGYQILEKIGKGSMGIVYKAKQTSVDRIVALKVLLDSLSENREFVKRFDREAKIAAKLSHPNIVNAIDAGQVGTHFYFVMEFIEGETIKDFIDRGVVFDEKPALEIIIKVAEALKHAHERGLIHRDIKPENIILTKDRNVKLADLGLARPTADEKWANSEAGMAIGTPYYISPEQVRGQVDVDIRADIYGLGASLYHMTTGRVAYTGETPAEVMKKHADKNVALVPADHINTRLSSGLGVVIETMMEKNRDKRYATPDDLIVDLKALLEGERPMIAEGKSDPLEGLHSGDVADDAPLHRRVTDVERQRMTAALSTSRTIALVLGVLLTASALANIVMLTMRS